MFQMLIGPSDISNPQSFSKPLYKPSGSKSTESTKLYDVMCSKCGKGTKVIFEPVTGRPVYCKNCLKKIKSGEITPVASAAAPLSQAAGKPGPSVKWTNNAPAKANKPENMPSGNSALGDLGIEFAPSPSPRKRPARPERTANRDENFFLE